MLYIKRPIPVEAVQWFRHGDHPEVFNHYEQAKRYWISPTEFCRYCNHTIEEHGVIKTPEGWHIVCPSDFVIRGIHGEHYPCKQNIFLESYEEYCDEWMGY